MKIEGTRFVSYPDQLEFPSIRVTVFGRWFRLAAFLGSPPGSHMGLWRTDSYGLKGLNYRVELGGYHHCFTVLAHTKKEA
jgi:hypothetical protein